MWGFKLGESPVDGCMKRCLNSYAFMLIKGSHTRVHSLTLEYQGTSRHPQTLPKTTRSQIPNEFHPATPNKGHYMTPTQTMHCYEGNPSKWVPFNDLCPTKWHLASRPEQDFLLKLPIRHDPCKECYLTCFIPPWSKSNLYTISMANLPNKTLTWSQAPN